MVNVLVTAIGGGGHGEQVLKALTYAPKSNYVLFGSDSNINSPQKSMVSEFFTFPNAHDKNYLDNLYKVIEAFKIDVLIHG